MNGAPLPKTKKAGRWVFFLSLGSAAYWGLANVIDIYRFAALGAIYELLWLPFLALLFGLPVISLVSWAKGKFKISSLYLYSFLLSAAILGWKILR